MGTCAEALASALREAGVEVMFGLPGGEILDFIEAARRAGIRFLLTRHEATAAFMADVTGQITRRPGVCVSTLGPGAVNMTLGVANAYLDRSPVIAITAALARAAEPFATHQQLDLNAVYRPFTKLTITLDGVDTRSKVSEAIAAATAMRMGPVHIALPSDVARNSDVPGTRPHPASNHRGGLLPDGIIPAAAASPRPIDLAPAAAPPDTGSYDAARRPDAGSAGDVTAVADAIAAARRPVVIVGLDVNPSTETAAVRAVVQALGVPVFVTPKAKGLVSEDHPLYCGVCAGVAGDPLIVEFLGRADLLVGIGFDPVESDKLWHHTMPLVSVSSASIAAGAFRPRVEAVGRLSDLLEALCRRDWPAFEWPADVCARFRNDLDRMLRPAQRPRGISPYELTRTLRSLFPRDTILATDVGSIKSITTQAWRSYEPLTFLESNGLSAMSYSLPAAMAARLHYAHRPVLCTIGDGGFGMTLAELETCVRERLHFVTVVFNDSALSLIDVAQQNRGYPTYGVRYGRVDFAAVAAGCGAWARRAESLEALEDAIVEARAIDRPVVIDAIVDPAEYLAHHPRALRNV